MYLSMAACQLPYLFCQAFISTTTSTLPLIEGVSRQMGPWHMSSSPDDDEQDLNFFDGYDDFIEELDAALTDDYAYDSAGYDTTGSKKRSKYANKPPQQKKQYSRNSSRSRTSRRNSENDDDGGALATEKDDAVYDMFLSNLEKDMIEGWRKQKELEKAATARQDVPLSIPHYFHPHDDQDSAAAATTTLTAGTNDYTTTTEDFLKTLSMEQLKERLREAGLPVTGRTKSVLIQRLLGQEGTETERFLAELTVPQLKERLREAGLPITGRKAELIDRLLGNSD